jgi:ligand-binding sensor domain-containing protein
MRLGVAVLAAFVCAPAAGAAPAPPRAGGPRPLPDYTHESWQANDGLPQITIEAILQGRDGYLWLGTQEGLVRFDGLGFEVFDRDRLPAMTTNHVGTLLEDPDGGLWLGTLGGGLLHFRDGRLTAYTSAQGLSGDSVTALLRDREGRLWVGTESGGVDVMEAGRFRIHGVREGLPSEQVNALLLDGEGAVWVATARGLARVSGGQVTTFGLAEGLPALAVTALVEDAEGRLWAGTTAGLAWRKGDDHFRTLTERDGLPHDEVRSLHVDPQGSLWVGTTGGLARRADGRFESFTSRQGLTNDAVLSLFTDREGSLWIGTNGGGLNRLREGKVTTYGQRHGLHEEDTYAVTGARAGGLWVGSFRGEIHRFDGARFEAVLAAEQLGGVRLRTLHEDSAGRLWIGTDRGLHLLPRRSEFGAAVKTGGGSGPPVPPIAVGLPSVPVRVIYETRDHSLWVGTDGAGLFRLKEGRLEAFGAAQGLPSTQVRAVLEDQQGRLWVGTYGGLAYWEEGRFHAYTTAHGLGHAFVRCLHESSDGTLWIGTYGGGLSRWREGRLRTITSAHGLLSDALYAVVEDGAGPVWMSCNKGIFRAKRADLEAVADGRVPRLAIEAFDEADGMGTRECNGGNPGAWRTADGRLWFATPAGVVGVDPARLVTNHIPPPVVIQHVRLDGREAALGPGAYLDPRPLRLEFQYAALSLVSPKRVRYRYQLEGLDRGWVEAGSSRVAQYTQLQPGQYRFRVVACNSDGLWNPEGASLALGLAPAFHETPWFAGLVVLGIGLAGLALHRWRVVRLQRRETELSARVQEGLARIKVLSGLLPICAACKNIRDDQGYWSQIEVYIREHSEAQFTHGLCPACVAKLYPEYAGQVLEEKQ